MEGRVIADRQALQMRGIRAEGLIQGVEVLDASEIRGIMIKEGERVLTF
jgi:sulfur relay (sulfurtransferase) DsrF/TusC family protein